LEQLAFDAQRSQRPLVLFAAFIAGNALEDGVEAIPAVVDWPES
jgi:hypothetical protein